MNDDILTAPARRIREARFKLGLSQEKVAIAVGVYQPTVTIWESKTRYTRPQDVFIDGLARTLGLDVQQLFILYALADLERARRRQASQ